MPVRNRHSASGRAPIARCCMLCGQAKTIYPMNQEHRRAHQAKQIAYVCEACAAQVRMEVELAAASGTAVQQRVSA